MKVKDFILEKGIVKSNAWCYSFFKIISERECSYRVEVDFDDENIQELEVLSSHLSSRDGYLVKIK